MIAKLNVKAILVPAENISPDAEENISLLGLKVQRLHASLITLRSTLLLVLVLGDLLRGQLGVHVHKLKDLGANLVKLAQLNVTKDLDVVLAPNLLLLLVHGLRLTKLVLHGADHILSNLADSSCVFDVHVGRLAPLCDECVQISLTIDVGEWVTCQSFSLKTVTIDEMKFKNG